MEQRLGFELVGFSKCSGYLVSMPLAGSGNPKSVVVNGAGAPRRAPFLAHVPLDHALDVPKSQRFGVCVCVRVWFRVELFQVRGLG